MSPVLASVLCAIGILTLFALDRDRQVRASKALWIPVVWLLINGSRSVTEWLAVLGFENAGPVSSPEAYLEGTPADRLVFLLLLAAGVVVLIRRWRQVVLLLKNNGVILLFFAFCAASILWSHLPFITFKHWTKGIGDFVMVLVVLTDPQPQLALRRLLARVGFLLLPLSVLFIKYYPDIGRTYNRWTWRAYQTGVATNKNTLGMICLVIGLASLWRLFTAWQAREDGRRPGVMVAHSVILAIVVWLFSIADSATPLACFLLAGGVMAMTQLTRFGRKPVVIHLLVAAVLLLPIFALFLDSGGDLVQSLGRDSTLTGRTEIWRVVLGVASDPWLGPGYETFWLGDRLQKIWNVIPGVQEAHNGYLEVYLNLGWAGVGLLAVLIVSGYRNVIRSLKQHRDAASLMLAYFVTALIYSFSEVGFRMMLPVWIFFLMAITCAPEADAPEESVPLRTDYEDRFTEWEPPVAQQPPVSVLKESIETV